MLSYVSKLEEIHFPLSVYITSYGKIEVPRMHCIRRDDKQTKLGAVLAGTRPIDGRASARAARVEGTPVRHSDHDCQPCGLDIILRGTRHLRRTIKHPRITVREATMTETETKPSGRSMCNE